MADSKDPEELGRGQLISLYMQECAKKHVLSMLESLVRPDTQMGSVYIFLFTLHGSWRD